MRNQHQAQVESPAGVEEVLTRCPRRAGGWSPLALAWSALLGAAGPGQGWAPGSGGESRKVRAHLASGVSLHVDGQVVVPVEGPAALRALVGPLAGVDALVPEEVRGPAEGFAAVGAGGPALAVARVLALVQQQALPLREEAQALAAVVDLGGRRPPPQEGMAALGLLGEPADDRPGHHHLPRLKCRVGFPPPGRRADPGLPVLLLHVGPLVDGQVNLQAEALAAVGTGEGPLSPAREDAGRLTHRPWWPRVPCPHPGHSPSVEPAGTPSPAPGPFGDSALGLAWGLS